eukprot:10301211-Lingulodinium_polyedra.AAC.1
MGWAAAGRARRSTARWAAGSRSGVADSKGAARAPARRGQGPVVAAAARAPGGVGPRPGAIGPAP